MSLHQRLSALRARARLLVVVRGAGILLAAFFGWALLSLLLDFGLHLETGLRAFLLLAVLGLLGFLAARCLFFPLSRPVPDDFLALRVERRHPELSDLLISAVQFSRGAGPAEVASPAMVELVLRQAGERAGAIAFEEALDHPRVSRTFAVGAAGLLVFAGIFLLDAGAVSIWAKRNLFLSGDEWPKRTHLSVEGFPEGRRVRVPKGEDLGLAILAEGKVPDKVFLLYTFQKTGAQWPIWIGPTGKDRFLYKIDNLIEDLSFVVRGGDDKIGPFHVQVIEPPRILAVRFKVAYPPYTGRPPEEIPGETGAIPVPEGGTVTISIQASKPLEKAVLSGKGSPPIPLVPAPPPPPAAGAAAPAVPEGASSFEAAFPTGEGGERSLDLLDREGLDVKGVLKFNLRVQKDQPPQIRLAKRGVGDRVTPQAVLPIEFLFRDDHGLKGPAVRATQNEGKPADAPLPGLPAGAKEWAVKEHRLSVEPLRLMPGDALKVEGIAGDLYDLGPAHEGKSDRLAFKIVTPTELKAELLRRQQAIRREFERLIDEERLLASEAKGLGEGFPPDGPLSEAAARSVSSVERAQRAIGRHVGAVAEQLKGVLEETENNRIGDPGEVGRLENDLLAPLRALENWKEKDPRGRISPLSIQSASEDLYRLGRSAGRKERSPLLSSIPRDLDRIIGEMEAVLKHMKELEHYAEVIALLQDIKKKQQEVRKETEKRLKDQIRSLLPE